jgi:hypothetical protein
MYNYIMSNFTLKTVNAGTLHLSSSDIQCDGPVTFNNNATLNDLNNVSRGDVLAGDVLKWDGSNFVNAPEYINGLGSNLSLDGHTLQVDLSSKADASDLTTLDGRVTTLENATEYISSVSAPLAVTEGELSIDLSDYPTNAVITGLDGRLDTLENATEYISSVGANLSVSDGELNVDLNGKADADEPVFSGVFEQHGAISDAKYQRFVFKSSTITSDGSADVNAYTLEMDNEFCELYAKLVVSGTNASGVIDYKALYKQSGAGNATLIYDNVSQYGGLVGSEMFFNPSAKNVYVHLGGNMTTGNYNAVLSVEVLRRAN